MRKPIDSNVLEALSYADEVLLLVTHTQRSTGEGSSLPAFLDRRFIWYAVAAAFTRGIPIRCLLDGMTRRQFEDHPAIPPLIKDLEAFDSLDGYTAAIGRADMLDRIKLARKAAMNLPCSHCRVCLLNAGRGTVLTAVEKQLQKAGIQSDRWRAGSKLNPDSYHALAVFVGDGASAQWNQRKLDFVKAFEQPKKPIILVAETGSKPPPAIPECLQTALPCKLRKNDPTSFLQLVWAITGYRRYFLRPHAAGATAGASGGAGGSGDDRYTIDNGSS